jgi:hypothetical protein
MSRRRGAVAVPLITLITSFTLVLILGAWLGTPTSRVHHRTYYNLSGKSADFEPFPGLGLRVIVSQVASIANEPTGGGEYSGSANICTLPAPKLINVTITGTEWTITHAEKGRCRIVPLKDGNIGRVEIRLEQK